MKLTDFEDDAPWTDEAVPFGDIDVPDGIAGVRLQRLMPHGDKRGDLTVLASDHYGSMGPMPHIYFVTASPHSVRAWVYHKRQDDRLAFATGEFRVVLYDLRETSPTFRRLQVLDVGAANPVRLTIPAFVVHGVQNRGNAAASFVNMPTQAYDPSNPDKSRVRWDHPDIPYQFD